MVRAAVVLVLAVLTTACGPGRGPARPSAQERSDQVRARVLEIGRAAAAALEPRWRVTPAVRDEPEYCDDAASRIDWGYLAWVEIPDREVPEALEVLAAHWRAAGASVEAPDTIPKANQLFARFDGDYGFSVLHVKGEDKFGINGSGPCIEEPPTS